MASVANELSEAAATRMCDALRALKMQAVAVRGGSLSYRSMREKAWKLAGRKALIGLGILGPMIQLVAKSPAFIPALLGLPIAFGIAGYRSAAKQVAIPSGGAPAALPPRLAGSLARVVDVVPVIEAHRHREGLRAVVQRLLALRDAVPPEERARLDEDLARVLDLAVAAAVRVDELERRLAAVDLVDASRRELQERDAWAARLLDASAQLDALRARWAAARSRGTTAGVDEALAELRAEVEAFEEVQKL